MCVSTMNIMVCLSVKKISLNRVKVLFDDEATKTIADRSFAADVQLQKDHEFNNSVIVKYKKEIGEPCDTKELRRQFRTIAIKVFVNGTLQISGCRSIDDALMNGQLMCRFLEALGGEEIGTYTVTDFDVHMVNCNFSLGPRKCVVLTKLHQMIEQRYKLFQRYDASNHAGLIITMMSKKSPSDSVTVMVFANANIIITGFKTWSEMVDSYTTIMRIFDECSNVIMTLADPVVQ